MTANGRPVAAVDCGTNSTRLLVAAVDGTALQREMVITRLGQGVDGQRRLQAGAISRTVAVLAGYRKILDRYGVQRLRVTATSAARDASNRDQFFRAAHDAIGAEPELLSGDEEGQLSFAGAVASLASSGAAALPGPYLVADIGGGSTELAAGPAPLTGTPQAAGVRSLDVGCVRLSERYLHHDPPLPEELSAAREEVRRQLDAAFGAVPALAAAATLVGLAGTVAALAAIDQGLDHYQRDRVHHYRLRRAAVEAMLAELAAVPSAARRQRPGVEAGRADVIVGGVVVLAELMAAGRHDECLTSEADILDGLAATLRS